MTNSSTAVILDNGGQWMRAGFSGDSFPRAEFQSVIGSFRELGLEGLPEVYCGHEAISRRGVSNLSRPMKKGLFEHISIEIYKHFNNIVATKVTTNNKRMWRSVFIPQNWQDMEKLLHHTFYKELMVAPEESTVMYALHPLTPAKTKEQLAELLFETFTVESLYLALSPALVTLASGRTTGLVWENGYSCCYAAPVFEGFTLKHSIVTSELTGQALTTHLQELMMKIGYSLTTPTEIDLLEKIKADICYVTTDYEPAMDHRGSDVDTTFRYDLPDGQHVILGHERFECPEMLFTPSLQGLSCPSIVDDICKSISKCDMDYQNTFYQNIVLSGGSSQFPGLADRLSAELRHHGATVEAGPARAHAAWRGGAMMASLTTANECYLSRHDYEDAGVARVQQKFY